MAKTEKLYGTGRRKKSIARVYLVPGKGDITRNTGSLDEYFGLETLKVIVKQPLVATNTTDKYDVIVNVQGDEPMIPPEVIDRLAECFTGDSELQMATLKVAMDEEDYNNPAAVKVVTDLNGYALYFSRSLMPYPRNKPEGYKVYKHVGIYAYRRSFLLKYAALQPTPLERAESLEQLRALENGYKIKVLESDFQGIGVDTPEDLAAVNELFAKMNK